MQRIALTGGIATGKSHVRARLEAAGIPTIDADVLARQAVAPGTPGLNAVRLRFGPRILDADGAINRKALAQLAFSDPAARADLERIIHPEVRQKIDDWFRSLNRSGQSIGVADIPLLFETGREQDFDTIVVTTCSREAQLRRLMARDHLSESDARLRIQSQMPQAEKVRRADYVITTDASIEETDRQVDEIWQALTNRCL